MERTKNILITGGTGSFGRAFVKYILESRKEIKRVVVFSRDELKQWEMQKIFPDKKYPQLRFFLGDVRDSERLEIALENIDTVIHAAALKQVPAAEYNPMEFIKTNVIGADNLVKACLRTNVKKVIALSTDKAAAPINLYGASKLCSDKLFIAANNITGSRDLRFSVVRYGNVMGSRGSVIPLFNEQKKCGCLTITDERMTRFNISLKQGVEMVIWAMDNSLGGEIFVPKIPSYKIMDVANAICPNCKKNVTGIRAGEKIHEEMITTSDSITTYDIGNYYAIFPAGSKLQEQYKNKQIEITKVEEGFSYNSGTNDKFLSVDDLRRLIRDEIGT